MPVMRYFLYVGAALLALLFVVGEAFPTLPAETAAQGTDVKGTSTAAADIPMIRIHSDRKWPERVVFDTNAPTVTPAQTQIAKNEKNEAPTPVADVSAKVTARDALAQLAPTDMKKPIPKPQQKRRVAKRHVAPPPILVAQQQQRPQFGFFANNIW